MEMKSVSMKDVYFLHKAMGVAMTSQEHHKHGCIITKGSKILSWGINSRRNHPRICTHAPTEAGIHAEVAAIKKIQGELKGAKLYVARTNNFGQPLLSKPCKACECAIKEAGIKKIVWTE